MTTNICSVGDCHRDATSKGYCGMHYARVRRTGKTVTEQRLVGAPLLDRLWFRSEVVDECWISHRGLTRRVRKGDNGYPGIRIGSEMAPVHLASYRHFKGEPGEGMQVHRRCLTKRCWNPDHLVALTPEDHKAEHRKAVCKNGHELTEDNIYRRPNQPDFDFRECLTCKRDNNRRRSEKRSAERKARRDAKAPA